MTDKALEEMARAAAARVEDWAGADHFEDCPASTHENHDCSCPDTIEGEDACANLMETACDCYLGAMRDCRASILALLTALRRGTADAPAPPWGEVMDAYEMAKAAGAFGVADELERLKAEYAAAIERGMLATAELQGKLAEATIKLRLLPSEAAWQEGARMLHEADRARQRAEAELELLKTDMAQVQQWFEAWRKAESAVECEACAVIGASLPEGGEVMIVMTLQSNEEQDAEGGEVMSYSHMCRDDHLEIGHSTNEERCPVCIERDRADAAEAKLAEAQDLLLLAYHSGHREGWEAGPTTNETMGRICDWLANEDLDPNLSREAKRRLRALRGEGQVRPGSPDEAQRVPPLVELSSADLLLMRSARCAKPDDCPVCSPSEEGEK